VRTNKRQLADILGVKKLRLLSPNNLKIVKSNKDAGTLSVILHLAPSRTSGYQVCPMASAGCIASCLNTSGNGRYDSVQRSRVNKTRAFFEHRQLFVSVLSQEIGEWTQRASRQGKRLCVRLNGTSDIAWERIAPELFTKWCGVQFYDYTKIAKRLGHTPVNYHLTFSRSENNVRVAAELLDRGHSVAAVYSPALHQSVMALPHAVDGTLDDRRWLDPDGSVVALVALDRARKDTSGFVVR
jgi:hypothetical protein